MSATTNSSISISNDWRPLGNAAQVHETIPQLFTVRAMGLVSFFSGGLATAVMGTINELRLNHPQRRARIMVWIGLFAGLQIAFLVIAAMANLPSPLSLGWYGLMAYLAQVISRRFYADAYQQMEDQGVSGISWLAGLGILVVAFVVNAAILFGIFISQGGLTTLS